MFESARVQVGHYGYADEQVTSALNLNGLDHERGLRLGEDFPDLLMTSCAENSYRLARGS